MGLRRCRESPACSGACEVFLDVSHSLSPTSTLPNRSGIPVTRVLKQTSFSVFYAANVKPSALSEGFGIRSPDPGLGLAKRHCSEERSQLGKLTFYNLGLM